ncbi:MAG: MBL fold metallo-hydrolase, partial [Pontibacterium sp.]
MKTSCLCGGLNTQLLWVLLLSLFTFSLSGHANTLSYNLAPKQIAQGVWVLEGKREDFSHKNGGNIVNTGFIVGESGVVVIDTGPSKRYGQALRAQISALTEKPITDVLITHFHPDHFLGNQSFADIPIHALETTRMQINQAGDDFAENMYRLVGDWMRGTEVFIPQHAVTAGEAEFAGRAFELMALSGHTGADLVIFDKQT